MQFALTEHVPAKFHVIRKSLCPEFIHAHEEQLIDPTEMLDCIHEGLVKDASHAYCPLCHQKVQEEGRALQRIRASQGGLIPQTSYAV